ncbi:hypothetical protein [Bacteroides hominis]|uniref:hypothetical protein n=1 Tax=Bacteroides thetaiotaomicron TaxID=818 RepID=UPI0022741E6C|nr:hypothetical protein [Bacteroides fragilis]MCE8655331.1 hypothetical protein [Bacteroides fragilis]MCY1134103.1 hypothetical protein [Bacteroides fragilis]
MAKRKTIDDRILELLKEGPLVGFYFNVAVSVLKDHISNMSDEDLAKMFGFLLNPQRIRNNIGEMYNRLNDIKEEPNSKV